MKSRAFLILPVLLLAALACQALTSGTEEPAPSQPQTSSQNEPTSKVLFQDDFSDNGSGWDRVNVDDGVTDYAGGVYRIYVNTTNTDVWSNPGLDFSDVRVEVNATKVGGDDNNDLGVICRYQDNENFYFFVISSDGYYGVGKVSGGTQELIGEESMPPSEHINTGNASNRVVAECIGETLRIHVNDQLLGEYQDSEFTSGDVGLMAGAFDVAGTDIHFDNFVVTEP